ncbi:MAG: Monosaccharide-transporting ATPase [Solirubrobacterales bacterium]|nr:Monosaccharide-transporting ATPase [Solirubrobacterales bacterium]
MSAALEVTALSKTFEGQRALREVDFDVRPGEVHALVGQNGSGKSTLIKILAGFEVPDEGASARIGDTELRLGDAAAAAEARLCFVHQDLGLIDTMSVAENIALATGYTTRRGGRIDWRRERQRARDALDVLSSTLEPDAIVGDLAPVQRAAVAIARALSLAEDGGSFIVLDEPTASLPRTEAERLFEIVRGLAGRGMGVVLVSHHLDEVLGVADRVTVLRDGARVASVAASELDREKLATLIVGREVAAHVPADREAAPAATLAVQDLHGDALAGVSFQVSPGEILGLAGIIGSGREEIAPMLFGYRALEGSVRVADRDVPPSDPQAAIAAGLALVPADRARDGLILDMTVGENLTLGDLRPFWRGGRLRHREEREDVLGWLDQLDVQPRRPEALVHTLSGGNQQKVLLAKWLRLKPEVLVLDEPTQGVDVGAKVEIYAAVEAAAATGVAVLVSSSDPEELALLCDRVLVLRRGTVAAELDSGCTAEQINELTL